MPLEYPTGVVKEHTAVREAVGHLRRQPPRQADGHRRRAPRRTSTPTLSNDLGRIGHGKAQYTLCCDADDRRHRRRPDRLLPRRRARAARPQRRQLRRGRAPALGRRRPRASRSSTTTGSTPCWPCRARSPTRCSTRSGFPSGHEYMSFVEAEFEDTGVVVCRTGYTGERGYELIAAQRGRRRAVGRAARGGGAVRDPAVRPRRPRHPAHRDGLPAARPGHHHRRDTQPGRARLGGRLEEGRASGAATRWSRRRRPGRSAGSAAWSPSSAASRDRA